MPENSIEIARRREFGNRVRTLRKQCGLSREELAEQTNIPFKTIGDVERGEKVLLNVEWIVRPLADFFNLAGIGREEFFASAGLITDALDGLDHQDRWTELLTSFYKSTTFPALATNPFYTFHSTNASLNALYGWTPEKLGSKLHEGAGPNNIRFMLDPEFGLREMFGTPYVWRKCVEGNLYSFKVGSMRYIGTPEYDRLLKEFEKLPDFTDIWSIVSNPDYRPRWAGVPTVFYPDTPDEMQFVVAAVFPTQFGGVEQNRLIYIPSNEDTARKLEERCAGIEPIVYHYSPRLPDGYRTLRL